MLIFTVSFDIYFDALEKDLKVKKSDVNEDKSDEISLTNGKRETKLGRINGMDVSLNTGHNSRKAEVLYPELGKKTNLHLPYYEDQEARNFQPPHHDDKEKRLFHPPHHDDNIAEALHPPHHDDKESRDFHPPHHNDKESRDFHPPHHVDKESREILNDDNDDDEEQDNNVGDGGASFEDAGLPFYLKAAALPFDDDERRFKN